MKRLQYLILLTASYFLMSCNSNDNVNDILNGSGITITEEEEDCCSAEEALATYKFLQGLKDVPELSDTIDDKYVITVYTKTGSLHTGYNDIYFVATSKETGNYVKSLKITELKPLMHMVKMDMYHSTPSASAAEVSDLSYPAVKHAWISFVMNTNENGTWSLSYRAATLYHRQNISKDITVSALGQGQEWIKSFKVGDDTYYISLINPNDWQTGNNTISAIISRKSDVITDPYQLTDQTFVIEFTPEMPDMGGHSSPGNEPLTLQSQIYKGVINLTMTGLWRIHLTVKDANGTVVAGGDDLKDGLSSLYFDVTL